MIVEFKKVYKSKWFGLKAPAIWECIIHIPRKDGRPYYVGREFSKLAALERALKWIAEEH